jgi:hypothetical protein
MRNRFFIFLFFKRTCGLRKLFSRLDSNFQKPEGPRQTDKSFPKTNKNPLLRKIEAEESPPKYKGKLDQCFTRMVKAKAGDIPQEEKNQN